MKREESLELLAKDKIVNMELIDYILGDFVGYGISRLVYDYRLDPKYVIKLDLSNHNANVLEHDVWRTVEHTKHAKWFAPVKDLSPCGRVLLQEKCKYENIDKFPKIIPDYLSDIKVDNFGWLNGKFVCLDYAGNNLLTKGLSSKMKKVKWYNE